jgi:hypothetical protein
MGSIANMAPLVPPFTYSCAAHEYAEKPFPDNAVLKTDALSFSGSASGVPPKVDPLLMRVVVGISVC